LIATKEFNVQGTATNGTDCRVGGACPSRGRVHWPPPDTVRNTETDWDAAVQELLASRLDGQDVWLFAYGSLLWNPAVEHVEERMGMARGWHRSFWMRMRTWRGTLEQPGLMMELDRGGQCKGVALRLAGETVAGIR
jgi:cation transport protein ChaC